MTDLLSQNSGGWKSEILGPAWSGCGESSISGLHTFWQCPHMVDSQLSGIFLSGELIPSWRPTLMTSSKPTSLPKNPSPNTIISGVRASIYEYTATAKSLQSCLTLCDPIDGSPPGSPVPGILQARTLEWVAISFSNAWKWKWKWSRLVVSDLQRPLGLQPSRLLHPWDFPGRSTGVGCHCLFLMNIGTA